MLLCWFLDVSFHVICFAFAAASPQPLTPAHCFKTLGSDWLGGLLGCWVTVVDFLFRSVALLNCVLAYWLLDGSSRSIVYFRSWTSKSFLMPKTVIWEAWCLHFGTLAPFWYLGHAHWETVGAARKTWGSGVNILSILKRFGDLI